MTIQEQGQAVVQRKWHCIPQDCPRRIENLTIPQFSQGDPDPLRWCSPDRRKFPDSENIVISYDFFFFTEKTICLGGLEAVPWPLLIPWTFSDDTHTCCRTFSNEVVTACFYDLGLLRLGYKHPTFRLRRVAASIYILIYRCP